MISTNIKDLNETIQEIAEEYLNRPKAELNLCMMMQEIIDKAESFAEDVIPTSELSQMDCKAGCSVCCRVNVPVLLPEAVAIKNFLVKTKAEPDLDEQIIRMKKLAMEIKHLEEEERILAHKPCAFLNHKGACSIYPVRPIICRSVTSADASACKAALTMVALGEVITVPMNINQKSIMDTTFMALASALKKYKMDDKSYELTSAVLSRL